MKTVVESQSWKNDSMILPIPWRDQEQHIHQNGKKLTVGVMWTDDVVTPSPAVTRALNEVVERLKLVDTIEVIEWKAYRQNEALEILVSIGIASELPNPKELTGWTDQALCARWWQSFRGSP
jgi:Asp-tRNA(Asn)/Glu-tRNA(Gln) amidotransferase A subunit family amidase